MGKLVINKLDRKNAYLFCAMYLPFLMMPNMTHAEEINFDLATFHNSQPHQIDMAASSSFHPSDDSPAFAGSDAVTDSPVTPVEAPSSPAPVAGPTLPTSNGETASDTSRDLTEKARKFKRANDYLEATYQTLNVVDMVETLSCLSRHICVENNPILGKRPSTGLVVGFKVASGLLHYVVYRSIRLHPRKARTFEYISLAVQAGAVISNLRVVF